MRDITGRERLAWAGFILAVIALVINLSTGIMVDREGIVVRLSKVEEAVLRLADVVRIQNDLTTNTAVAKEQIDALTRRVADLEQQDRTRYREGR